MGWVTVGDGVNTTILSETLQVVGLGGFRLKKITMNLFTSDSTPPLFSENSNKSSDHRHMSIPEVRIPLE
jgi:hypothetical protein